MNVDLVEVTPQRENPESPDRDIALNRVDEREPDRDPPRAAHPLERMHIDIF